jgi:hypothetical protein
VAGRDYRAAGVEGMGRAGQGWGNGRIRFAESGDVMPTGQRAWKTTEVEKLKRMYPTERTEIIAEELGRSLKSVYHYAAQIGLKKSPDYIASEKSGRMLKGPDPKRYDLNAK